MVGEGVQSCELRIEHIREFPERPIAEGLFCNAENSGNALDFMDPPVFNDQVDIVKNKFIVDGIDVKKECGQTQTDQDEGLGMGGNHP